MTLPKIDNNGLTNALWRSRIDGGIDQINTNTTAIATNASNIASNDTDIATNASNISTNTSNIASNLTKINADILSEGTTLTITQSGGESTTQCVVSGHTSATFNASDYSNDAAQTINEAIESLPKNMGGHNIDIVIGTTGGQEITVSNQINIGNFNGGVVTVKSAKTADNSDNGSTKANKIVSAGTTIDRIISINKCSECNISGLELKENTGTVSTDSYVLVVSTSWSDINHCKLTGGSTSDNQRALLSQRGATVWLRDSWVDNVSTGILVNNSAIAAQTNCSWTGTQPTTGMYAAKSIGITDSSQNIQGSTNEYIAANGGLITNEKGIILEETILRQNRTVNFDNSMSVSDMQNIINDQPKNLNGYNITFQFADGTYDFGTSNLAFREFEGGTINIWGDQSDVLASDGTGLGVKIQSQATGGAGTGMAILVEKCSRVGIKKFAFEQNGSNTDTALVVVRYSSDAVVESCSFNSLNGTTTNDGVTAIQAWIYVNTCGFNNLDRNIVATQSSKVFSRNTFTFSGGTDASTNLQAQTGSIMTQTTTQAGGADTKEAGTGAVIFTKDGSDPSTETNATNIATNTTNIASNLAKINADLLQAQTTVAVHAVNDVRVTGHHSINYTSSTALQDAISALPKNMSGHNIIVQFQDGTYDFGTTRIDFNNFTGGFLYIQGNSNNTGSGTYSVIVQGQNSGGNGIFYIDKCQRYVVKNIEFQATGSGASNYLLMLVSSSGTVIDCKFLKTGGTNARGVMVLNNSFSIVQYCNFSALDYAVYAQQNSKVQVESCHDYGTKPVNGVAAVLGAMVEPIYTNIDSSTSNYIASTGGLITHKSGMILEETVLQASKTVNLDSSMSVTEIQDIINDQPKQLNTHTLTFQFADGEYDFLSNGITFHGFDGGYLTVEGNTSDTLAADGTGLSVKLKGDVGSGSGLVVFLNCSARCHIKYIAFEQDSTSVTDQRLLRFYSVAHGLVDDCSFNSLSTNRANEGVVVNDGRARINNSKFNNLDRAIYSIQATTHSTNNTEFSGGTAPNDGLVSISGSIITQQNTQINAHTNDTVKSSGGVIFNSNGTLA